MAPMALLAYVVWTRAASHTVRAVVHTVDRSSDGIVVLTDQAGFVAHPGLAIDRDYRLQR